MKAARPVRRAATGNGPEATRAPRPWPTLLVADTICRTVELGVTITGAAIAERFTHIDCRPVEYDPTCPTCGQSGRLRDHVTRVLTDLPIVGHPTRLHVRVPRFTCVDPNCSASVFRQSIDKVATPKASTTRRTARWILQRLALDKMSVAAIAISLGVSWNVVNSLAVSMARDLVRGRPGHLDGVRVLGVDEHKWKHVRGQGDPSFIRHHRRPHPSYRRHRSRQVYLGISHGSLTTWLKNAAIPIRRHGTSSAPRPDPGETPEQKAAGFRAEVAHLQAERNKLETERDILRSAAKYAAGKTNW